MIIIDPSETNERSPLKTGEMSPTTPLASGRAPPPPYDAAAEPVQTPVHSYHSVQAVQPHQQIYVGPPPTGEPFKRFIKAFLVAIIALFLWGVFIDSVDMAIGTSAGRHGQSQGMRIRWLIHGWYAGSTSNSTKASPSSPVLCPCLDPTAPTTPGRVLPIRYPPVVEVSKSSTLPIQYHSALPQGEIEMLQHPSLPKSTTIRNTI